MSSNFLARRTAALWLSSAVLLASAPSLQAQVALETFGGDTTAARLGSAVTGIGDVNGDGVLDFAAASSNWGLAFRGRVTVFSGATSTVIRTHDGGLVCLSGFACSPCNCPAGESLGQSIDGLGDVNGNGMPDYILGAPYGDSAGNNDLGRAVVIEGAAGVQIRVHYGASSGSAFGWSVRAAGDLNSDGAADYVVGAPNEDPNLLTDAGAVYAYSGADGALLWQTWGYRGAGGSIPIGDQFGYALDALGDLTGDGKSEILVGAVNATAPATGPITVINAGAWYVLDGATGVILFSRYGTLPSDKLGAAVAGVGDIDVDGAPDFVVQRNRANGERVILYSGLGGMSLGFIDAPVSGTNFGASLSGVGDTDGDGVRDFAVGAALFDGPAGVDSGRAYVYSYANSAIAHVQCMDGLHAGDEFGASVDGLAEGVVEDGDFNGDGLDDVLVGAPRDGLNVGSISVYPAVCVDPQTYCVTTPNSVGAGARISSSGTSVVANNDLVLHVSDCPAGKSGLFFYGPQEISLPFCGATKCVGGNPSPRLPLITTGAAGAASFALNLGATPIKPHETWCFQFWYRDPAGPTPCGTNFSDALRVTFCPTCP